MTNTIIIITALLPSLQAAARCQNPAVLGAIQAHVAKSAFVPKDGAGKGAQGHGCSLTRLTWVVITQPIIQGGLSDVP